MYGSIPKNILNSMLVRNLDKILLEFKVCKEYFKWRRFQDPNGKVGFKKKKFQEKGGDSKQRDYLRQRHQERDLGAHKGCSMVPGQRKT